MEIILIRHTSVEVPPGICYGQTDVGLRETFQEEAAITLKKLKSHLNEGEEFDQVYTSPLSRCVRLATYCGYADAEKDDRIMEINFGDWEMKPYDHIDDPKLQEWYADYLNVAASGGESFAMQYKRVSSFLNELKEKNYNKVAIFAHGGVLVCAEIYAGLVLTKNAFTALIPFGEIIKIEI